MTVIRPNSVAGINSITVQSGNSLAVHKANGELIRTLTSSSGVSTFSTLSVGTATTDNSAAKSINIGLGASISQHADNSLSFGTVGDERLRIDSSGRLLLGTFTEGEATADDFTIGSVNGTNDAGITIRTASSGTGRLFFSDGTSGAAEYQGYIQYNHSSGLLSLGSGGSTRLTIDDDGNVNVGTAATIKANGNATFSGIVTATSFIGDGSGLSGVTATTINSNADNRIITGSGTANTLNGESNLTFNGNALTVTNSSSNTAATFQGAGGAGFIAIKDGDDSTIAYIGVDGGNLKFQTSGSSYSDKLLIKSSGGLGISTDKIRNADFLHIATQSLDFTNPTENLMDGGGICFQTIDNLASTGRSFPGIFWAPNTNELGRARAGILGVAASNNDATDIVFVGKYLPGGDALYPRDERMRIRAQTGYVGINTSLPDRQLHIVGSDGPTQATVGNSDTIFVLDNKGTNGAIVEFKGDTNGAGRIMFTDPDNSNQGKIEYLHSTDVLQFSSNGGNPGYELQSDSKSRFNVVNSKVLIDKNNTGTIVDFDKSGTSVGTISITSSNTSYNTSSDYRLKENVVGITSAITRLKTLKPSRFNFKIDPSVTVDGFLAHEVTAVPEATTGTKDQVATADDVTSGIATAVGDPIYQGIDQSKLVPLLTAALQEAITKIETLETKVAALEGG